MWSPARSSREVSSGRESPVAQSSAGPSTGAQTSSRPDPALRMADGTVLTRPTSGGLPLGIDPDADYPTTRLTLEPGETMLICTDGLLEIKTKARWFRHA
mgnify:CR=1 FL=1